MRGTATAWHVAFMRSAVVGQNAAMARAVDTNGNCQILAPALRGERVVMTYSVDLAKQGGFVPPVAASLVCECDADYNKKVNLTVVLRNNIAHRGVQFVTLEVRRFVPLSPTLRTAPRFCAPATVHASRPSPR